MKKLIILAITLVTSFVVFAQTKAGKIDKTRHQALYVCPVNSKVIVSDLSKCPFCGMDLNLSPKEQIKTHVSRAYSCPLYADITSERTERKLNISPKEEMKLRVVRLTNQPVNSIGSSVARQ